MTETISVMKIYAQFILFKPCTGNFFHSGLE